MTLDKRGIDTAVLHAVGSRWAEELSEAVRVAYLRADSLPLLVRIGVPVGQTDPYAWLRANGGPDRVIWRSRHHNKVRAAFGAAAVVSGDGVISFGQVADQLADVLSRPGDEMRFFGGMRFDPHRDSDAVWTSFGGYRFVLPRFELHVLGPQAQVYCNLVFPEDYGLLDEIQAEIKDFHLPERDLDGVLPLPISRADHPEESIWKDRVRWALETFSREPLEKVVLARRVDFDFQKAPDALLLLKLLARATPNCFHFHFESTTGEAFIGATPERLFFRNGLQIESEAVAGTRPRGDTRDMDEEYRTSLLESEKELREHAYVRDSIRDVLEPFCVSISVDYEATEMRLARGRHLISRISGILAEAVSDLELVRRLHPTPAVGGHPTPDAMEVIRKLERFDRGWYAGPIGWIGRDVAEFVVALRCGVVSGKRLSLFSGAGIVEGSQPAAEWREIEQKIEDFINVLGLDIRVAK